MPNQACLAKNRRIRGARRQLAGQAERDRAASFARTHTFTRGSTQATAERGGGGEGEGKGGEMSGVLAGGELHILNTNDLFQGGMCKEYTVLMRRGCNAVTSRLPA